MSAVSDRDKKIIYFMLIIMVICLPYFFFIKSKKEETVAIQSEVEVLQARYEELKAMDDKRGWYIEETERLNEKRDVIIASFPEGIDQAVYTMFLLQTEYSADVVANEVTGVQELQYQFRFDTVSYGTNVETAISSEDSDLGLWGVSNESAFTYACRDYDSLKYLLAYFVNYEDPMIYSSISMDFDAETGNISGDVVFDQYAVTGGDREPLAPVDFNIEVGGETHNLDLDDNGIRGNVEDGIFGPVIVDEELEEDAEAAEGDAEAEGTAEEAAEE